MPTGMTLTRSATAPKSAAVARELQMMWAGSQRESCNINFLPVGDIAGDPSTEWICQMTGIPAIRPAIPAKTHAFSEFA